MTWARKPLKDVADFCLGKMLDQKKNKGDLVPYLANVNVRWGEFDLENLREMRVEPRELERYGIEYGDIVMCEGGEPGRCAIWKEQIPGMTIQKALHRIRPYNTLNNQFLYYTFLHKGKKGQFAPLFTGATIKHLPKEKLAKVEIDIPPLSTQERIVEILSAYDELIENNRRRIELLEQSARLLYKEWFVHLRFPGHENTKITNGIPEGWEVKSLPEVIEINPKEKVLKGVELRYIPMGALSTTGMTVDLAESEIRRKGTSVKFRNGDTLFARITPCLENGKTGYVNFLSKGEVACGSTEFIILRGKKLSPYFLHCLSRTYKFRGNAINSMTGSSGRQRVQTSCFNEFVIPYPPKELLAEFDALAWRLFAQIETLVRLNEELVKARNLLLPRLMNGDTEL